MLGVLLFILGAVAFCGLYTTIGYMIVGLIERWNKDVIPYGDAEFIVGMWAPAIGMALVLSPLVLIVYLCIKLDDLISVSGGLNKVRQWIRGFR